MAMAAGPSISRPEARAKEAREAFEPFSASLIKYLAENKAGKGIYHETYCPMVKASWLQRGTASRISTWERRCSLAENSRTEPLQRQFCRWHKPTAEQ